MAIINMVIKGSGTTITNQDKTITENGTYTYDDGFTGLGTVSVDVPTYNEILATPNSINFVENKNVLVNDGTLMIDTSNPITSIGSISAISENGFCISIEDMTFVMREFKNGIVGDIIETNSNYTPKMMYGLETTQIPMYGNTILSSYEYFENSPKTIMTFKSPILSDSNTFKHMVFEDIGELCLSRCGSFADRYIYTVGSKTLHIYDVVLSKMFNIDINGLFGTTNVNIVCVRSNGKNYIINVDENNYKVFEATITESLIEFVEQNGSISDNHYGEYFVDFSECHQTKDERYVLLKNGFIEFDSENVITTINNYDSNLLNIFAGVSVSHIQPLYDGYIGFGLEDGRYILCNINNGSIITPSVIYNFEPIYISSGTNSKISQTFFSGYAEYIIGKINALSTGIFKRQIKECETSFVVKNNSTLKTLTTRNTFSGCLKAQEETVFRVKTLPLDIVSKTITAPTSNATLSVEGLRSDILKGVRYND